MKGTVVPIIACLTILLAAFTIGVFTGTAFVSGPTCARTDAETLYQVWPFENLLEGGFNGTMKTAFLPAHGDTGLGTFDNLDGEMIMINSTVYRAGYDGKVVVVGGDTETPFAEVAWLHPYRVISLRQMDMEGIQQAIAASITDNGKPHVFRVDGEYANITVRSVPPQAEPYPRLADAVKNQSVFRYSPLKGSIVGFWLPESMGSINVPGFHMHFISDNRTLGGHVLGGYLDNGQVWMDDLDGFRMSLPDTLPTNSSSGNGREDEVTAVEKGSG